MKLLDIPFKWDLERAIDDWVFMCFFVGNDFLPHLPSLEIREGAVELLIGIWKSQARKWNGYLTDSGEISLERVQSVMEELGVIEDVTFQNRREEQERQRIARFERKQRNKFGKGYQPKDRGPTALRQTNAVIQEQMSQLETFSVKSKIASKRTIEEVIKPEPRFSHKVPSADDNLSAAKKLKLQLMAKKVVTEDAPSSGFSLADFQAPVEETVAIAVGAIEEVVPTSEEIIVENDIDDDEEEAVEEEEIDSGIVAGPVEEKDSDEEAPEDNIRLWETGWKQRYYEKKFQVNVGDEAFRQK